jgi:hypothetical protein
VIALPTETILLGVEPVLFYLAGFVATAFVQLIWLLSYEQSSCQTGSSAVEMPISLLNVLHRAEHSSWTTTYRGFRLAADYAFLSKASIFDHMRMSERAGNGTSLIEGLPAMSTVNISSVQLNSSFT